MLVFGCSVNLSLASTTSCLVSCIACYNNLAEGFGEVTVPFILFSHLALYSLLFLLPVGDAYPRRTATTSTGGGQPPVLPTPAPPPPSLPLSPTSSPSTGVSPTCEAAAGHGGEFRAGPTSSALPKVESTSSSRAGPTNSSPLWPGELQAGGQAPPTQLLLESSAGSRIDVRRRQIAPVANGDPRMEI
jgi:hypothetical protein